MFLTSENTICGMFNSVFISKEYSPIDSGPGLKLRIMMEALMDKVCLVMGPENKKEQNPNILFITTYPATLTSFF